jgi:hypothetical protein
VRLSHAGRLKKGFGEEVGSGFRREGPAPPSTQTADPSAHAWCVPGLAASVVLGGWTHTLRPTPGVVPASCTLGISGCTPAVLNDRANRGSSLLRVDCTPWSIVCCANVTSLAGDAWADSVLWEVHDEEPKVVQR